MSYSPTQIEVLRFAARTGGVGIGCCAIDLIQGFVNDPDSTATVKLTHGDTGTLLLHNGKAAYLGRTNHEIFLQYLRIGTFDTVEMPDRIFLAAITKDQCETQVGKKWLKILKENGFEFIRATNNSVYGGTQVPDEEGYVSPSTNEDEDEGWSHPVYLFGLFRNISTARLEDPLAPPAYWNDLPECSKSQREIWYSYGKEILTEEEATGKKAPTAPVADPFAPSPAPNQSIIYSTSDLTIPA